LPDRFAWAPAHTDVEHFALRRLHVWFRLRDEPGRIFTAALRDVYRRVRGICGCDGMARGAFYASGTTRSDHRLYASICLDGRPADQRCILPRGNLQFALAADSRRTRSLALYGHVRTDSGDSSDRAATIS